MIKQIVAVTWMNLRSLPQRISTAWVIVIGTLAARLVAGT